MLQKYFNIWEIDFSMVRPCRCQLLQLFQISLIWARQSTKITKICDTATNKLYGEQINVETNQIKGRIEGVRILIII